jgi:hypothetical protein
MIRTKKNIKKSLIFITSLLLLFIIVSIYHTSKTFSCLPEEEAYLINYKNKKMKIKNETFYCTCTMDKFWDPTSIHYNCYSTKTIWYLKIYDFFTGAWNKLGNRLVRQGEWIENYPNGKPRYKGFYYNGLKSGKFIYYNNDGSIKETIHYE